MAWVTPKTNWTADDFIEVADWDRIRMNLEFLRELACIYFPGFTISPTEEKTRKSWLYAKDLNAIEDNLAAVNAKSAQLNIGEQQIYQPNGYCIDYVELNRIESACVRLYDKLRLYINSLLYADNELYADDSIGII